MEPIWPTRVDGVAVSNSEKPPIGGDAEERSRLGALTRLARRALMVERAWPPLVLAVAVVVLFFAASWLGVWQFAPRSFRIAGVVLFALAGLIALSPLARLRRPAARDVLARLDRDAGTDHRPASSLADRLANDDGDPGTHALWAAHRARLERAVEAIRVAPPSPRMAERDPYALRFGAALIAFAAAIAAGPEMYGRLASAFDWRSDQAVAASATSRIDAWIDPPPYAGRPPVVIDFKTADPQTLNVPEDSILVVRGDPSLVETRVEGAISPSEPKSASRAGERADRTAVDGPRRRQGDNLARPRRRGRCRPCRHARRRSDDRDDRGSARQYQRVADARLPRQRSVWADQRQGGLCPSAGGVRPAQAHACAAAASGPATAADRQRRRRRAHDRRPLRAPLGGRQGDDDAERDQRFGQDRPERADRGDAACSGRSTIPWRARWSNSAATSFSTPTTRRSASRRR